MVRQGIRVLDPVSETRQIEWVVMSVGLCPTAEAERHVILSRFRRPHEEWPGGAFAMPVRIRRSRNRVLFCQESGIGD